MKCQQKINGKQCGANAILGSQFCYHHDPKISQEEKRKSQMKGGQNRNQKVTKPLDPVGIVNACDITFLIADTINQVRVGDMDCRVANTIGYLAGVALKSFEISSIEKRLEKIELLVDAN